MNLAYRRQAKKKSGETSVRSFELLLAFGKTAWRGGLWGGNQAWNVVDA